VLKNEELPKRKCNFASKFKKVKYMEISGKIIAVLEKRSGQSARTGANWASQEYVIETIEEQYPRRCMFNVFGEEKINEFNIKVGDMVTVSFDINAREYNGRWYNDIRAWRVVPKQPTAPAAPANIPQVEIPAPTAQDIPQESAVDDLPF
jgi:hypothetical protein